MGQQHNLETGARDPNQSRIGKMAWSICALAALSTVTLMILSRTIAGAGLIALIYIPVWGVLLLFIHQRHQFHALKATVAQTIAARHEAETAARENTRVLATMSHEIRTPLNGVLGMLSLLNDSELSPQQRNYSDTARSSARTLLTMVDEVLDTARSESRRKAAKEPVDITSFIEGITELLAPRAHSKGIEVSARIAPDVPKDIVLDELHLRQVLFNLAGNAIKFTQKGGVAIEVAITTNRMLSIKVCDSGIGMTKEEAAKIFTPYAQGNDTTQARFGGTGLGLSISRDLVTAMGGTLTLDTAPSKGSAFTIELHVDVQAVKSDQFWHPLARRHYVLALPVGFARNHLALTLTELGAEISYVSSAKDLAQQLGDAKPLRQFICGTQYADTLRLWAKKRKTKTPAVVWAMLTPEERHAHANLLRAPFAGYLLSPLRRSTLFAQLSSHDVRSLKQTGHALRDGRKAGDVKPQPGLSILLAEDNPINALLSRTILEKAGHDVRVVGDGGEALDLLRSDWHCDLAILDVEMPWVSGIKVAELLRRGDGLEHRRTLPLLATTGNVRPEDVRGCLDAGFNAHLPKPFDRLDLEDKVSALTKLAKAA